MNKFFVFSSSIFCIIVGIMLFDNPHNVVGWFALGANALSVILNTIVLLHKA